jgi:hypothetical protein
MIGDEVGVRPAGRPDAPSGNRQRGRPCQACERMTCRPQGHGRVPIMCWGAVRQGQGELLLSGAAPEALILKADWCGGVRTDTRRQRMRARRWSPWSVQRSSRRHPTAGKTGCIGVVCPLTRVGYRVTRFADTDMVPHHSPNPDRLRREFRHHGHWQAIASGWVQVSRGNSPPVYRRSWPCVS